MPVVNSIIKSRILVFDVIGNQFNRIGERLFLLRRGVHTSSFVIVREIENGWFAKSNTFRAQMQFEIATLDETFADDFAVASHIGYGKPSLSNQIDVYSLDIRDKTPPNGIQPTFKAFGTREDDERFLII